MSNFYLNENECVTECPNYSKIITSSNIKKCIACHDSNCKICANNIYECSECGNNYFLEQS